MVSTADIDPTIGVLTGPTATGKTALALERAQSHGSIEIVNADSLLVYRGMDVGTAKPGTGDRARVPHHLIDIREPHEPLTAGDFHRLARATITTILERGRRPLVVGGSGFYLKALLYGLWDAPRTTPELRLRIEALPSAELHRRIKRLDPASAQRIGVNDRYRLVRAVELLELSGKTPGELQADRPPAPDPRFELWVVDRPPGELDDRIRLRSREMLDQGLIEETRGLLARYPDPAARPRALAAIGYAQVIGFLEGRPPPGRKPRRGLDGLVDEIELATRQLVKRQRTWFRGEKSARWFLLDAGQSELMARWKVVYRELPPREP